MLSKDNIEIIKRVLSMTDSDREAYYKRLSPGAQGLLEELFRQYEELLNK